MATTGWKFINDQGDFLLENPQQTSYLYFPLANDAGMMSSISPLLQGDIKINHNAFLMPPVTAEDFHNSRSSRNFWVYLEDSGAWSATGNSAPQIAAGFSEGAEQASVRGGFLWHQVTRADLQRGIAAAVTSFVPAAGDTVELMQVKITNLRKERVKITPTAAIPLYGRSADNLRDHRHVTSLLNRIATTAYGVEMKPTFCFDERGHKINHLAYGVLGAEGDGAKPVGFFPLLQDYIGEGGSLEWPETIVKNSAAAIHPGAKLAGYEAIGALRFADRILEPGERASYIIAMVIHPGGWGMDALAEKYCSDAAFEKYWALNQEFWDKKLNRLSFASGDSRFDNWVKWVNLQPLLRRIYGCSFLPHHDYGRGGRGWRDLWQDCMALLISNPAEVRNLLANNYAGVRIDGSNATIIGPAPGEFIADRNNICRVWMDHGAWPFLTTKLYIDQSGDLEFLLQEQTYFKDSQAFRSRFPDPDWRPEEGNRLKQENGELYRGTILEHILVELMTQFYNVGEHHQIRLEGADWNDAMDMASAGGESVAFTALYAYNLKELSRLVLDLRDKLNLPHIVLAKELAVLCDTIYGRIDYQAAEQKRGLLDRYFQSVQGRLSGETINVALAELAEDLRAKADWLAGRIRAAEWIENGEGFGWFNGYYNNDRERVEGDHPDGVRMTLTGQVFPIMSGIASREQVVSIVKAVDRYLMDPVLGGYRLNSDFGGIQPNLGRGFGFAFGHKENGAIFSHMAVMYGNALYKRGFVREGYAVFNSLYQLSGDFQKSRIYPGLPEYINDRGRGMYHYLTGSASWYLMTLLNEAYGVKGRLGDLVLEPKLLPEQFDQAGIAKVVTFFAGRELEIVYQNPRGLDYGLYQIRKLTIDGRDIAYETSERTVRIKRELIEALGTDRHRVQIELG